MFAYPVLMRLSSSAVGGEEAALAGLMMLVVVRRADAMVEPVRRKISRRLFLMAVRAVLVEVVVVEGQE